MTLQLFKWMMALAIMLYLPLLFERVRGIRRIDRKHSDEYIKERVESIYFDVTHFYNGMSGEAAAMPESWPDFDRLYCSEAWNEQVAKVQQREEKNGEAEGFFSRNYWIGGKELEFLYINKVEVIDRTGDQGTVALTLHNGDRAVPVLLCMVFENDDWRIDNMTYYWNVKPADDYFDWRQQMEQYAESN
jgi:hypothetical protein